MVSLQTLLARCSKGWAVYIVTLRANLAPCSTVRILQARNKKAAWSRKSSMLFFLLILALTFVESSRLFTSCFSSLSTPHFACTNRQPLFSPLSAFHSKQFSLFSKNCPANVQYNGYTVKKFLGSGCYGAVFLGERGSDGERVAIKVTHKHYNSIVSFHRELSIYQVLNERLMYSNYPKTRKCAASC